MSGRSAAAHSHEGAPAARAPKTHAATKALHTSTKETAHSALHHHIQPNIHHYTR